MIGASVSQIITISKCISQSKFNLALKSLMTVMGLSLVSISGFALAQPSSSNPSSLPHYQIEDFSDDYYALITPISTEDMEDEDYSESNSIVSVIDAKTKRTLISQPTMIDIEYELDKAQEHGQGDKISANIVNIPYGEHSVLIYDDFNFDHQKDVALQDGRYGCYGGPSYQVYLKAGNTFKHSEAFSELTHGNCGFFGIDKDEQTLYTMAKSGAAWHLYTTYKVVNNKPVAVHIIEEEYNSRGLVSITESKSVHGKMVEDSYEMLPYYEEEDKTVYSFDLNNGKRMVIDSYDGDDGEHLYYAFADKNDRIELLYDGPFDYDRKTKTLSFINKPMVYSINGQGINVKLPHKTVMLKSKPTSIQGNLEGLAKFENVKVR